MPFVDVINDYTSGATGTLTATNGDTVNYTVSGTATNASRPGITDAARISANGDSTVTVTFDQPVHGMTLQIGRSNLGEIYFIEIDGVVVDLNTAIANGDVVFTENNPGSYNITSSGGIEGATNSGANANLGFLQFETAVTSVRIFGTGGNSGNFDLFEIGIDSVDFRVVCFATGTRVKTPSGDRNVEDLAVGDLVQTASGDAVPVLWTQSRSAERRDFLNEPRLYPIRIAAGALGHGLPSRDLLVSRQHRMLVSSRIAARITGATEVLIPAIHLVGVPGITVERGLDRVDYVHLLLEDHQVLLAEDAPSESLLWRPEARKTFDTAAQAAISTALGFGPDDEMTPVRPIVEGRVARKIAEAHVRHGRPLLECYTPMVQSVKEAQRASA